MFKEIISHEPKISHIKPQALISAIAMFSALLGWCASFNQEGGVKSVAPIIEQTNKIEPPKQERAKKPNVKPIKPSQGAQKPSIIAPSSSQEVGSIVQMLELAEKETPMSTIPGTSNQVQIPVIPPVKRAEPQKPVESHAEANLNQSGAIAPIMWKEQAWEVKPPVAEITLPTIVLPQDGKTTEAKAQPAPLKSKLHLSDMPEPAITKDYIKALVINRTIISNFISNPSLRSKLSDVINGLRNFQWEVNGLIKYANTVIWSINKKAYIESASKLIADARSSWLTPKEIKELTAALAVIKEDSGLMQATTHSNRIATFNLNEVLAVFKSTCNSSDNKWDINEWVEQIASSISDLKAKYWDFEKAMSRVRAYIKAAQTISRLEGKANNAKKS